MAALLIAPGVVIGERTVLARLHGDAKPAGMGRGAVWLCRCACGAERAVRADDLRRGVADRCMACARRQAERRKGDTQRQAARRFDHAEAAQLQATGNWTYAALAEHYGVQVRAVWVAVRNYWKASGDGAPATRPTRRFDHAAAAARIAAGETRAAVAASYGVSRTALGKAVDKQNRAALVGASGAVPKAGRRTGRMLRHQCGCGETHIVRATALRAGECTKCRTCTHRARRTFDHDEAARLYGVEGWTAEALGVRYGVHPSTVVRAVAAVRRGSSMALDLVAAPGVAVT